jgi:hypothetical protein
MTKKKVIEKTIAHWKWLSEQPDGTCKGEYPGFKNINSDECNDCFLCKYKYSLHDPIEDHYFKGTCPVFGKCEYQCKDNPEYIKWRNNHTAENAKLVYLALLSFYNEKFKKEL